MSSAMFQAIARAPMEAHFAKPENQGRDPNIIKTCVNNYAAIFKHTVYGIILLVVWLIMWMGAAIMGGSSSTFWINIRYAVLLMGLVLVISGIYYGVLLPEKFEATCLISEAEGVLEDNTGISITGKGYNSDVHPASISGGCATCASGGCPGCSTNVGGGCATCDTNVGGGCPSCSMSGGNSLTSWISEKLFGGKHHVKTGGCGGCSGGCAGCAGGKAHAKHPVKTGGCGGCAGGCASCAGGNATAIGGSFTEMFEKLQGIRTDAINMATSMTTEICPIIRATNNPTGIAACDKMSATISNINNIIQPLVDSTNHIMEEIKSIKNFPGAGHFLAKLGL